MVAVILSRMTIVFAGVLYPAYSSFKAVRRKSHKEYTKWMMYWIVFALFLAAEMVLDTFVSWLPLYYELKIVFVLWLVLPITEGSKQLYRVVVHPFLLKHEGRIDQYIAKAGQSGFRTLRRLSQAGINRAATTVLSSAIKGQAVLAETLLRNQEGTADKDRPNGTNETDGLLNPSQGSRSTEREMRGSTASSTDLEPFEVISDGPDEVYETPNQPVQQSDPKNERVESTASSGSMESSGQLYQTFDSGTESEINKKVY